MKFDKVMIARIAWSEAYSGGTVYGTHGYLQDKAKKARGRTHRNGNKKYYEASGHEAYNFSPYRSKCYGYIPPSGKQYVPPHPKNKDGWLVIFVAPYLGYGDPVAVGWYENASFERNEQRKGRTYKERPCDKVFPMDDEGEKYTYCVCTDESKVHLIKSNFRTLYAVPSRAVPHLGRTWIYLEGQNSTIRESFKKILMSFVKRVVQYSEKNAMSKIEISDNALRKYCPPETEVKEKIEKYAIDYVTAYYNDRGYNVNSVESENCGWDLTVKKESKELHVEVKGTSRPYHHFFLSKHEYEVMMDPKESNWFLFSVNNIGNNDEEGEAILTKKDVVKLLIPFVYEGEVHVK